MKTILSILALTFAVGAQAKTANVACQLKAYSCSNNGTGMSCVWVKLGGRGARVELEETDPGVWIGSYSDEFDGHHLILRLRYDELDDSLHTGAELWTPQVSAQTSGSDIIDIGLHNINYGRGFYCGPIRIRN